MAFIEDPQKEIKQRLAEIGRQDVGAELQKMDEKELAEREAAAKAYAGETEQHFVDFLYDCVGSSVDAMVEIRRNQKECLEVYEEKTPEQFANKEPWQSKTIIPKPFGAGQFAMSIVRKAFDVQFLSVENKANPPMAEMWKQIMATQLDRGHANFPIRFTDASGMSFVVGTSMEMLPVWKPGKGLEYVLVEPWKIHRDPDAISREPQSGMYWIHQEYLDWWVLKDHERKGKYRNIPDRGQDEEYNKKDPNLSRQEIAKRKGHRWNRSSFRTMMLTSEFWGTILDSRGEVLLPSGTYTVVGDKVIGLPKRSPYKTLRWPGIGFSVLPHFLRFDGRGLVEGIKSIWKTMCSIMCLHVDNLNWIVNPMTETNIHALVDPTDIDIWPGKNWLTKDTPNGQQCVRTVERRSNTNDILANLNFCDQRAQEGLMVTYAAQGLPGYRAEVTAREASQNLEQSMNVFGLMGLNLEEGALKAIEAGAEVIATFVTLDELIAMIGPEASMFADPSRRNGVSLPPISAGTMHVSGVSTVMQNMETVRSIRDLVLPLFSNPLFVPYLKPYNLVKSLETRLNLRDEGIIINEDKAAMIDQVQQQNQEQAIMAERDIQMSQAHQAAANAMQSINAAMAPSAPEGGANV